MKSKKQVRRSINKSKKFRGKSMKGGEPLDANISEPDQNYLMRVLMLTEK